VKLRQAGRLAPLLSFGFVYSHSGFFGSPADVFFFLFPSLLPSSFFSFFFFLSRPGREGGAFRSASSILSPHRWEPVDQNRNCFRPQLDRRNARDSPPFRTKFPIFPAIFLQTYLRPRLLRGSSRRNLRPAETRSGRRWKRKRLTCLAAPDGSIRSDFPRRVNIDTRSFDLHIDLSRRLYLSKFG